MRAGSFASLCSFQGSRPKLVTSDTWLLFEHEILVLDVFECIEKLKGTGTIETFQLNLGGAYVLIRDPSRSAGTGQGRKS